MRRTQIEPTGLCPASALAEFASYLAFSLVASYSRWRKAVFLPRRRAGMSRRLQWAVGAVTVGAVLVLGSAQTPAVGSVGTEVREGGDFRVSLGAGAFDHIDPALAYGGASWAILDTVCATLMRYPDKPPPDGYKLAPEVAKAHPRPSDDGRTWTFTLRTGFRFSDGTPVRASAFARAINRTLAPGVETFGAQYTQGIVGAEDVQKGKAKSARGVVARGNTLIVRFKQPVPDFPAQTTMPFFCAVPPGLPSDPEGVGAFPAAGPYYVADYRPGERIVIERNPHYGGRRPHHVDGFLVDLRPVSPEKMLDEVEQGDADWGRTLRDVLFDPARGLAKKYGINKSRFFVKPGLSFRGYALNTSRPLFRNNARLRQAVNFAIDRSALEGGGGRGQLTDQYLPATMPGFEDALIYPLRRPDLRRARALARGNTRGGKAVLYTLDFPQTLVFARTIRRNLAKIGLDVQVKGLPQAAFFSRAFARGEAVDIVFTPWTPDYIDPFSYLNVFFESRFIGGSNNARFDSLVYDRLLRRAAGLKSAARARAYGLLDVRLARDAAPMVATTFSNEPTLVSMRVGCIVLRPELDLTAVCLK
jgi:peptide/nickel transport system substrate-binding protein